MPDVGPDPLAMPPVDIRLFCCSDPSVGGCSHSVDDRDSDGRCTVIGCGCMELKRHPDNCIHQPPPPD
jgi:hypothetical protein